MTILHIDFETFSACELKDAGLDNYAKHPTTGVHCMAWAFDDEPVHVSDTDEMNVGVLWRIDEHVKNGGLVYAHNAAFELAIWNNVCVPKYGWPELKPEQCRCTMAMAYAMSLPGSLEKAAIALDVGIAKDMKGARVMMQLAKPKEWRKPAPGESVWVNAEGLTPVFWTPEDAPEKFQQLYDYCKQDVEVERALHQRMMELSDDEQKLWTLDYKINQRGIQIDIPAVDAAIKLVETEKARLNARMLQVTGGVVGSCTEVQLLVKWIRSQGVAITGLAKADVLDSLSGDLPPAVRAALELRKEAAKSSTAKLVAMKERASSDGRVRGTMQYHGASTGRWAGRGIQVQNFPRPRRGVKPKHIADIFAHLGDRDYIDMMYGPVLDAVSDGLRGMLVAGPGSELVAMDFANIEGRVLAWLAGEQWKLDAFSAFDAGVGPDIYKLTYSKSFNKPVGEVNDDNERQVGKVEELAFGFGGGVGAGQNMARIYGVRATDEQVDSWKRLWREAHPRIVRYWYDLESAAINACEFGVVCRSGPANRQVAFKTGGSFLWCRLPSGRVICYPYPKVLEVNTPWGEKKTALTFMTELDSTQRKKMAGKLIPDPAAFGSWVRIPTYGGSLAENVTQAVARDLLAEAMPRLDASGYPIVFHAHDEAVVEIPSTSDDAILHRIESLMSQTPSWAAGLPVTAEGWRARRYRK